MKLKSFLVRHISLLSPRFFLSLAYLHNRYKWPNLSKPKDLSEIWIKKVVDGEINKMSFLADKYAVRSYVENKGLSHILTPLISVYHSPDDIDYDALPNRFAMKANYGAGYNVICTDKSLINKEDLIKEVSEWFIPKHYSESEQHYNLIKPCVVAEEFIDDGTGGFPVDYKFMCIRGKVHCILGVSGRSEGEGYYLPYSKDWEPLYDYYRGGAKAKELLEKPKNLNEMIDVASKLAGDIDLVRVDLYSNGSRIWFGEMTLTPAGCIFHRWTQKALDIMGAEYRIIKNV